MFKEFYFLISSHLFPFVTGHVFIFSRCNKTAYVATIYPKHIPLQKDDTARQFEQLVKDNELLIRKVCSIYAYTHSNREDLFQDIVIQLWTAFPRFRGESKISTWLYRVAINTSISALRKKKNFIHSWEPAALPTGLADAADSAVEEQLQQLYGAIEQLNEIEKAIVMLYLEDRSYEEMEEILGMSQGNLRVKMNRVKNKLRGLTKTN